MRASIRLDSYIGNVAGFIIDICGRPSDILILIVHIYVSHD